MHDIFIYNKYTYIYKGNHKKKKETIKLLNYQEKISTPLSTHTHTHTPPRACSPTTHTLKTNVKFCKYTKNICYNYRYKIF